MKSCAAAFAGSGDNRLLAGPGASETDIGAYGVVEQHYLLADDGDRPAQAGERNIAHVLTIDQNAALRHVVEARDQ